MPGVTPAGGGIVPSRVPEPAPSQEAYELDELLGIEDEDRPVIQYTGRALPGSVIPYPTPAWEELTSTEDGYLLRHGGKIYAAVEVDAVEILRRTVGWRPAADGDA